MANTIIELTERGLTQEQVGLFFSLRTVAERIRRLSHTDLADLLTLSRELNKAESEDERTEILSSLWEILDGTPLTVRPLHEANHPDNPALGKWTEFVSARIREHREAKGWTQKQLADAAGLPQSHVSRLETGKHSPANITLQRIAKALDVDIHKIDPNHPTT